MCVLKIDMEQNACKWKLNLHIINPAPTYNIAKVLKYGSAINKVIATWTFVILKTKGQFLYP